MPPSNREHWLAVRRAELYFDQDRLSRRLQAKGFKVSRSAVSHWETGKSNPPLQEPAFRVALAEILKLTVSELLQRAGYEIAPTQLSEQARELAVLADELNPLFRQDLLTVAMEMIRAQRAGKTRAMVLVHTSTRELTITYIKGSDAVRDADTIPQAEDDNGI